jgi:hypothetical protein
MLVLLPRGPSTPSPAIGGGLMWAECESQWPKANSPTLPVARCHRQGPFLYCSASPPPLRSRAPRRTNSGGDGWRRRQRGRGDGWLDGAPPLLHQAPRAGHAHSALPYSPGACPLCFRRRRRRIRRFDAFSSSTEKVVSVRVEEPGPARGTLHQAQGQHRPRRGAVPVTLRNQVDRSQETP